MSFKKKSLILSLSTCIIIPRQQLTYGCMRLVVVKESFPLPKYLVVSFA